MGEVDELFRVAFWTELFDAWSADPGAPLIAIAAHMLAIVLFIPTSPLIIAAQAVFGPALGSLYALIGCVAGAGIAYALGRAVGRRPLARVLGLRMARIENALSGREVAALVVINLSFVVSVSLMGLFAGAIEMRPWPYVAGMTLGLIPSIVLLAALEQGLALAIASASWRGYVAFGLAVAVLVVLAVALIRLVRRGRSPWRP